jgi:hypothetical protein
VSLPQYLHESNERFSHSIRWSLFFSPLFFFLVASNDIYNDVVASNDIMWWRVMVASNDIMASGGSLKCECPNLISKGERDVGGKDTV